MAKRIFYTLLTIWLALPIAAQTKGELSVGGYAEYGHENFHYGTIAATAAYSVIDNFTLKAGLNYRLGENLIAESATASTLSAYAAGCVTIPIKSHRLEIENHYLLRELFAYSAREMTGRLTVGWRYTRWLLQVGLSGRLIQDTDYDAFSESAKFVYEPFNLIYLAQVKVFKQTDKWNLGLRISNTDYFLVDRAYNPIFTLFGEYKPKNDLLLWLDWTYHPAGTFNLTANPYQTTVKLGIAWNK